MRLVKFTVLCVSVAVVGVLVYAFWLGPRLWPGQQTREAIRLLSAAQTPQELTSAVGRWGAFITITNSEWLAIRYRDSHSFEVQSMAVVRDSGNQWFQSQRHFRGASSSNLFYRQGLGPPVLLLPEANAWSPVRSRLSFRARWRGNASVEPD
jgi:hypothetical protein